MDGAKYENIVLTEYWAFNIYNFEVNGNSVMN